MRRLREWALIVGTCMAVLLVPGTAAAASNLVVTIDPNAPKAVLKDTPTYDVTATIQNFGDTAASNVQVYNWYGSVLPSAECIEDPYWSGSCAIASIPAGSAVNVTLRTTNHSSYGSRSTAVSVYKGYPTGEGPDARSYDQFGYFVTDGTVEVPRVDFASYPRTASRGETVHYFGTVANLGTSPFPTSVIAFRATTFQASQAIQGMSISTGAPCAKLSDTSADWWRCPVGGLAPGAKAVVDITARFTEPSKAVATVMLQYQSTNHPFYDFERGAATTKWAETQLNGGDAADLDVTMSTPGAIKLTKTGSVTATVANAGPQTSKAAEVDVSLRGPGGFINLPANCSGEAKHVTCALGTIASGASGSVALEVMPTALGTVTIVATNSSATFDPVDENNRMPAVIAVEKAPPLPLVIKTPLASPIALAVAAARGIPTKLRCPRACAVNSELLMRRADVLRLGRAAAKGYVLVGSAKKRRADAGVISMRTPFAKKYRAKLAKSPRAVIVVRRTTITAADGGKRVISQNIKLSPRRR